MHIDLQGLVALGVGLHLLAALAKAVWKTPQRQAQIDTIEQKVNDILTEMKGVTK